MDICLTGTDLGLAFFIQLDNILLIGMFRPVKFNVIIYMVDLSLPPCCLFSISCICFFCLSFLLWFNWVFSWFHFISVALIAILELSSPELCPHSFQPPQHLWPSNSTPLALWGGLCLEPFTLFLGPECTSVQRPRVADSPCLFSSSQESRFLFIFSVQKQ